MWYVFVTINTELFGQYCWFSKFFRSNSNHLLSITYVAQIQRKEPRHFVMVCGKLSLPAHKTMGRAGQSTTEGPSSKGIPMLNRARQLNCTPRVLLDGGPDRSRFSHFDGDVWESQAQCPHSLASVAHPQSHIPWRGSLARLPERGGGGQVGGQNTKSTAKNKESQVIFYIILKILAFQKTLLRRRLVDLYIRSLRN